MKIKAKKHLVFCNGQISFTKGKMYKLTSNSIQNLEERTEAIDNQKDPHILGLWYKHFTIIDQ